MTPEFETLSHVLDSRYSCRAFLPRQVPEHMVRQIVQAAGRVPSWCNAQPWQVTVTRAEQTDRFRAALVDHVHHAAPAPDLPWPTRYTGAYQERRRTCGFQLYEALGIARDDHSARAVQSHRNFELFDAPHVAIVSSECDLGAYGAMDCGGFVTAFTLAAAALGVASIAQASIAAYPDLIRKHFDLPKSRLILCAISFGYADETHPANSFRTARAGLGDVYDPRG